MALIKFLVQKGLYNHGGVKTNFSKLVLDKVSETNEGNENCRLYIELCFAMAAMFRSTNFFCMTLALY